jgi:A1 cistron-splicing factor AAR2
VQYPFLFAAISNDEDIVMACARILDEQRDVTLVREAAAYLEDVEAKM